MATPKIQHPSDNTGTDRNHNGRSSEETPLLTPGHSARGVVGEQAAHVKWLGEMWFLTKASIPVILAYMLQNSLQTVSVIISGRLSAEALAVAAFSYMFAMATAWLIALGGTSALDTLAASSFTGSEDKGYLGVLLQRGVVVLTGFYAVVAVVWCVSEHIFRALGQDEAICVQSARFLQLLIPGGLGYIYFECMKKFLQAQGIFRPGTYALCITSPLNAVLNYLLVLSPSMGMGIYGAPIATGISYWLSTLLLVAYSSLVQGQRMLERLPAQEGAHKHWTICQAGLFGRPPRGIRVVGV